MVLMRRNHIFIVPILLVLAGCTQPPNTPLSNISGGATSLKSYSVQIDIVNDSFEPNVVIINAGETVEWKWEDGGNTHNVTFSNGIHSNSQSSGTYYYTFQKSGTYHYSDTLHFDVSGTIIVK